jgi:hypothetical protein
MCSRVSDENYKAPSRGSRGFADGTISFYLANPAARETTVMDAASKICKEEVLCEISMEHKRIVVGPSLSEMSGQ